MDILIKTTTSFSRTNKYQRGCSFRRDKNKVRKSDLEWGDFVLREELKSFLYVDHSLHVDPKKYKVMDESNYKKCMR